MNPSYDVLVSGISSADLIFPGLPRIPDLGQEIASEDFVIKPGGSANTAVALHQLGLRVALVSAFGVDEAGRLVTRQLADLGMDLGPCLVGPEFRTPVSAVLSSGRERGFATFFGAWDNAVLIRRLKELIPVSRHVHGSIFDCRTYHLHELAHAAGKTWSIDMAWDDTLKVSDVAPMAAGCEVLFANEVEATLLTGCADPEEALAVLARMARMAVVKLGPKGSLVRQGSAVWRVPAADVPRVLDTTGAGDLYCAGFLYGHLKGWPVLKCAELASASGSLATTFYGGVDASYSMERVLQLMGCE
jgi:sugar/nucleoside kinase (ribokinase family)